MASNEPTERSKFFSLRRIPLTSGDIFGKAQKITLTIFSGGDYPKNLGIFANFPRDAPTGAPPPPRFMKWLQEPSLLANCRTDPARAMLSILSRVEDFVSQKLRY
jgi:hypothetical protein